MRRRRGGADGALNLNLTPLLDVVLQLITFFMMLIHFGNPVEGESESIRLPAAPAALPGGDLGLDRLVVSVDDRGRLVAADEVVDAKASGPWWADQARRRKAGLQALAEPADGAGAGELSTLVVVRADKSATYGAVRVMLGLAQAQGFARFSLVVLREDAR